MTLTVTLQDGRSDQIVTPEGMSSEKSLEAFVLGHVPFQDPWVKLTSGGYVRKDFIVAVRPA